MIDIGATLEAGEVVLWPREGEPIRLEPAPEDDSAHRRWARTLKRALGAGSREHVTIWGAPAWPIWLALCPWHGAPLAWQPRVGAALIGAARGVVHVRDVRCWGVELEDLPGDGAQLGRAITTWRDELAGVMAELGGEATGTGAGAMIRTWRSSWAPARIWHRPGWATTEELDVHRGAIYGGRVGACRRRDDWATSYPSVTHGQAWHGGLVHEAGRRPSLESARGAPTTELPIGWTLRRYDVRRAYQWAQALGDLAHDTSEPDRGCGRDALERAGLVEATVRTVDGPAPRLPVRVGEAGAPWTMHTVWPDGAFIARGVWSTTTLREVERVGGRVEEIHAAWTWARRYDPWGPMLRALDEQITRTSGPVRAALKGLGRRAYGAIGAQRRESTWHESVSADAAEHWAPLRNARGCTMTTTVADEYASHVHPVWAADVAARVGVALARTCDAAADSGAHVLYVDTDSVLLATPPHWTPPARLCDTGAPGGWRLDWHGAWALLCGARWYALDGERFAFAGVPRDQHAELVRGGAAHATIGGRVVTWRPPAHWREK